MNYIHLEPNMIPATLRGGYQGKKFKAVATETVTVPADAGLWSGGSCERYHGVNVNTGAAMAFPGQNSSPWNGSRRDVTVTLEPGFAVVRHSMFCGKDMGLTFYVHPSNAAALLPAPTAELSVYEKLVLRATASLKSSYNGQDRYSMMMSEYKSRDILNGETYPTRAQWDAAKALLIEKRLLNKAGAITPAGRNAA